MEELFCSHKGQERKVLETEKKYHLVTKHEDSEEYMLLWEGEKL